MKAGEAKASLLPTGVPVVLSNRVAVGTWLLPLVVLDGTAPLTLPLHVVATAVAWPICSKGLSQYRSISRLSLDTPQSMVSNEYA
jgi:hypothetical protein